LGPRPIPERGRRRPGPIRLRRPGRARLGRPVRRGLRERDRLRVLALRLRLLRCGLRRLRFVPHARVRREPRPGPADDRRGPGALDAGGHADRGAGAFVIGTILRSTDRVLMDRRSRSRRLVVLAWVTAVVAPGLAATPPAVPIPPLNQKVLEFARERIGEKVAD